MYCTDESEQSCSDKIAEGDMAIGTVSMKPNPKTAEIAEVEMLDPEINASTKYSGIAEKLREKRKVRHDELMTKLGSDLSGVNARIEENIRISSEEVKAHMKAYKDRLHEKLMSLDTPQVASYHESVFLDIQKEVDGMKEHQLQLVRDLYDDLLKFENLRSKEYKRIFHSSFQEVQKTAYILPYELQSFIEHEALKVNQLALNNRRCYEDLKLKLLLVTEQTFKSFMDEVFCLKEKWFRYNLKEAEDIKYLRREENKDAEVVIRPDPETRLELKRHELVLELTSDGCYSITKAENWFWNVNDVANALVDTKNLLIELYQQAIRAVQGNLRSDSEEVRKTLLSLEPLEFEERSVQPIMIISDSEEDFDRLEQHWQVILRDTKGKLEESFEMLSRIGELWNRHVDRLHESKILILKAVEKAEEDSVQPMQELEVKINLCLDALRQESNEEKLETLYESVTANLDAIKERMESDYANEVGILGEYRKMVNLEADVISAELKEFLYLKVAEVAENNGPKLEEICNAFGKRVTVFFSEVTALDAWKSELMRALKNFTEDTKERLTWKAEDWISSKTQEICRKYQTRSELHHKRYDRIRTQIFEVRQQEIFIHQTIFEEHKAGVEAMHRKLAQMTEDFHEKSAEMLDSCRSGVSSIVAEARVEDRPAGLKFIQAQMQRKKAEFARELAVKADLCQQEIEYRVSAVQHSNLKFMKSIRLFHENGNYDADEAKAYVASMEAIDKENSNEGKSAIKEIKKRETEIQQEASEICDDAIKLLAQFEEELRFYENVRNTVQLCMNELEELSADLKDDFDSLTKQLDSLGLPIADEKGFSSRGEDGTWSLLISLLYKNVSNLFYRLDVPEWLAYAADETEEATQEKPQLKRKDTQLDCPIKDFRETIFDPSLLTDDQTFMNTICRKCWNCMDDLQRTGCVFYKSMGGRTLQRGDLLKPSYEEFCTDTCDLFRSFALQCETVWLQTVREFLPVLGNVKSMLKTYFERKAGEYARDALSALDDYDLEFTNCYNVNSCYTLSELQNLDSKLLPLHGYPRNSHLLKALEEEVVVKTAELELGWEIFKTRFQNKLKYIRSLSTAENEYYQDLKRAYTNCKNAVSAEELGTGLLNFLGKIIDKRGYIKKTHKYADREAFFPYASFTSPREKKLNLHHLKGEPEDSDVYLFEIRQIIRRETAKIPLEPNGSREEWSDLLEPRLGLLRVAEEFEQLSALDMKRIKSVYRETKQFLRSDTNFHEEVILEWLDRWKENLERNAELYTVEYPEADDPNELCSDSGKSKVCSGEKTREEYRMSEKEPRSKTPMGTVSPGHRPSLIPVPSRKRSESSKKAAAPDRISPKAFHSRIARRITSEQHRRSSASVPKTKSSAGYLFNGISRSSSNRSITSGNDKRTENNKQCLFPKISSARKNSAENSINYTKSYTTITLSSPRAESDISPLPDSPWPNEKAVKSTAVSKTCLHCDFGLEERGESSNPQIEPLDLRMKDSESELFSTVAGSSLSSTRQTVSTESKISPGLEILRTPQMTIRTLSGDELVFSSSMEFDDLEYDVLPTENEETINELLKATEDESFAKAFGGVRVTEDEANEYDSEEATDVDGPRGEGPAVVAESKKMDPEKEMMTDVDYRQFVYHPTVLRRQMEEESLVERRPRSKSTDDNCGYTIGGTQPENGLVNGKKNFKKNLSQTFVSDRDVNIPPLRTWSEKSPQHEERQIIYSNLHLMHNSDYVLKEK